MFLSNSDKFFILHSDLSQKLSLCYYTTLYQSSEINNNDPIYKLLKDSDIDSIMKISDEEITKFIYFNREQIHKELYDSNRVIHFLYKKKNEALSFYFYLSLLIQDNPGVLNYTYDPDYIKKINKQTDNSNIFSKLFFSKIIIELANDYKETYNYFGNEKEKEFNFLIQKNSYIIDFNIDKFKKLNIEMTKDDFISKKIDLIYADIIISLINNKMLEDYDFSDDITKELDLEKIQLTSKMFEEIAKTLDADKNKYLISNKEDLKNENKINFYYILIKYILKNKIYVYKSNFLLETRKNIQKMIKLKEINSTLINSNSDKIKERLQYILNMLSESYKLLKNKIYKKTSALIKSYKMFKNKSHSNNFNNFSNASNSSFISDYNENSLNASRISLKKLNSIEEKEVSQLSCLKDIYGSLTNKEKREKIDKLIENNEVTNHAELSKLLDLEINKKEKLEEIIKSPNFNKLLKIRGNQFYYYINHCFNYVESFSDVKQIENDIDDNGAQNQLCAENFKNWIEENKNDI